VIFFFGYRKDRNHSIKIKALLTYIIGLLIYLIVIYFLGIKTSYVKNTYHFKDIENIIYIILTNTLLELIRYHLINKNLNDKRENIIVLIMYVFIDVCIANSYKYIDSIILICIISIEKNLLLNKSTIFGYKENLIYLFVLEVLPWILSYPELSSYLYVVFITIMNTILYLIILTPNRKKEMEVVDRFRKSSFIVIEGLLLGFVIITILLVSGLFKYSLSSIASNSMYPSLQKGDAIIIKKLNEQEIGDLQLGDIIAFREGDYIITHRIIEIEKGYYTTKGDNNNIKDVTKRKKDDIIGIVKFRIPYVGYPSVMISELFNK
jgi:signal peptidase